MKKALLSALFVLSFSLSSAQLIIEKIEDGDDFTFPVVQGHTPAADKINTILRLEILGNVQDTSIAMSTIGPSHDRPSGAYMMHLETDINTQHILSFNTDAEYCGAYCEYYIDFHSFDAQTGEKFTLRDLFTPHGYDRLSAMAREERLRMLKEAINKCDQYAESLKDALTDEQDEDMRNSLLSDLEINADEREIYERCIEVIHSVHSISQFKINEEENSLSLIRERCSAHYNRGIDNVGRLYTNYTYNQLSPLLSAYGRKILLGEENDAIASHMEGKLFAGTIAGKYSIRLLIERLYNDHSLGGKYYYERVGQGIRISGNLEGKTLTLREYNEDSEQTGSFDLILNEDHTKATGTWTSSAGKVLKVELSRTL
ncbi:hypothetical protein AB9P05_05155 [Roseivirga sp. BDSF3-8]|uniref:hypothetical protein n=1 Tax=Roseivirga sp. BDSF3-8 TaxID=3241598 RepID=UPI003531F1F8